MEQVQLQPVAGTHGDQFEFRVGEAVVGVMGWQQLASLVKYQLAMKAPSSITLKDDALLAVYELRMPPGLESSEDALQLEIRQESIQLSAQAAHDLACALLAYAGQGNQRGTWLVRVESGQG